MYIILIFSSLLLLLSLRYINQARSTIIKAGSAIGTDSDGKNINLDALTVGHMTHNGQGRVHRFAIRLIYYILERIDTLLADWLRLQITLDGGHGAGLFHTVDNYKYIDLQLTDQKMCFAKPNILSPIVK
ncbi:hypothetical protein [Yersinia ruckeri]|uniref:hypothetical protein n=1 Tax=Yersinia ruckeri TaxID=29486 RepID=UPI0020BD96D9|nr:hypothetical protein [Yersinia ruckeri]ELM3741178.1 hypothetical protein [Yersinia ruckeri]MCK8543377.1 hypothetical protein [Yersinia ruckeri]MCW6519421.1 hypothetical protein [Yersinia ruckeri]MCW6551098.1 hypothetical protein [Yersinia ruckeri]MCW6560131.1 hypothetical protein [Yersinia ruckeri]